MSRDTALDNVGGVMILYMMYRHCLVYPLKTTFVAGYLLYYPLLFFMAWFFFKGGMFHNCAEPLSVTLRKGWDRIVVPYIVYTLLAFIVALAVHFFIEGSDGIRAVFNESPVFLKREGALVYNAPLWFLPSLFAVRVLFSASCNLRIPRFVVAFLSLAIACFLSEKDFHIGLYFANTFLGLFFYSLGSVMRTMQYDKTFAVSSAVLYFVFLVFCYVRGDVVGEFNINDLRPYLCVAMFFVVGCVSVNNLFKGIVILRSSLLENIGRDSMIYFVTHFIVIYNLSYINTHMWHLDPWIMFIIIALALVATMPLVAKAVKHPILSWTIGVRNRA